MKKNKSSNKSYLLYLLVIVLYIAYPHILKEEGTVTVSKTERIENIYMVYTNKGTFKIEDDYRFFNFSSSDIYGKIQEKKTYNIEYTGLRIPLLSVYKNIVSISEY